MPCRAPTAARRTLRLVATLRKASKHFCGAVPVRCARDLQPHVLHVHVYA